MSEVVTYVDGRFTAHDSGRHHDHDTVHLTLDDRLDREAIEIRNRMDREGTAQTKALENMSADVKAISAAVSQFKGTFWVVGLITPVIVGGVFGAIVTFASKLVH